MAQPSASRVSATALTTRTYSVHCWLSYQSRPFAALSRWQSPDAIMLGAVSYRHSTIFWLAASRAAHASALSSASRRSRRLNRSSRSRRSRRLSRSCRSRRSWSMPPLALTTMPVGSPGTLTGTSAAVSEAPSGSTVHGGGEGGGDDGASARESAVLPIEDPARCGSILIPRRASESPWASQLAFRRWALWALRR